MPHLFTLVCMDWKNVEITVQGSFCFLTLSSSYVMDSTALCMQTCCLLSDGLLFLPLLIPLWQWIGRLLTQLSAMRHTCETSLMFWDCKVESRTGDSGSKQASLIKAFYTYRTIRRSIGGIRFPLKPIRATYLLLRRPLSWQSMMGIGYCGCERSKCYLKVHFRI